MSTYIKTLIDNDSNDIMPRTTATAVSYGTTTVSGALDNKVEKVSGKGLSTNDLTNLLKVNYDAAYTHSTSAHLTLGNTSTTAAAGNHTHSNYVPKGFTSYVNYTMTSSSWSNSQYSFETSYPVATYNLEICGLQDTATDAQKSAYSDADIRGNVSSNIVKACGTVPTVNIPIILKVITK